MTSLAYLWGRKQDELLKDMIDSGMKVMIIKTAAAGLEPKKHLGKTIDELRDHFIAIVSELLCEINGNRIRNSDLMCVERAESMSL